MNISTENFTSPEVHPFNNSITDDNWLLNSFRNGLLCLNLLFGIPTRIYILWIIAQQRKFESEFLNVNLTVCDLIQSMGSLFYLLQALTDFELVHRFTQGLGDTGRPLFQCVICVERYLAVVHPVTFLKYKPLRYRVICCAVVWILTLGSCVVVTVILLTSDLKAYAWFFSVQYFFFLFVQLFCLVAVLRALKQSGPGERKEENLMKRRAFHLILITTGTLVFMFTPFITTGLLCALQVIEQNEDSLIWFISLSCFILAGFVQPLLFLHRFERLFCFCSTYSRCFNAL